MKLILPFNTLNISHSDFIRAIHILLKISTNPAPFLTIFDLQSSKVNAGLINKSYV